MLRLALVCSVALSACASPVTDDAGPFASEADYSAQRAAAVASLNAVIGEPSADRLSACRAAAVGDKACGGPTQFSVYSVTSADAAEVEAGARRITELDRRANAQFEYVSTCELLLAPPLALEGGVCVAAR